MGWPLNAVCFVSLIILVLHDFLFAGSPELFQNAGIAWDLLYNLALALVASYVFFFVNIHLPRMQDRENLYPFLNEKTARIIQDAGNVVVDLREASGHDVRDKYPMLTDLKIMCSKVHPNSTSNLSIGDLWRHVTWLEYLLHYRDRTKETAGSIYTKISFLASDYRKLVIDIDECAYFRHIKTLAPIIKRERDITQLAEDLYDYLQKVKHLSDYAHRKFGKNPWGGSYKSE